MLDQVGRNPDLLQTVNVGGVPLEIAAAVLGLGLSLRTEIVIRSELASGQLRGVAVPTLDLPGVEYHAILPTGPRRAAVQQFVDWVRTLF